MATFVPAFKLGTGAVGPRAAGMPTLAPTVRNVKAAPATSTLILPRKTVGTPG